MSTLKAAFVILIVFVLMFVVSALAIWMEKNIRKDNYDERQKQARGNAYRLAFICGFVYLMLVALGCSFENASGDTWFSLIMYGLIGQAMILHIYCFLTHSALPLDERPAAAIIGWMVIGILDLIQHFTMQIPPEAGLSGYTQLVVGCCFILMSLMHLLSYLRSKKE